MVVSYCGYLGDIIKNVWAMQGHQQHRLDAASARLVLQTHNVPGDLQIVNTYKRYNCARVGEIQCALRMQVLHVNCIVYSLLLHMFAFPYAVPLRT